MMLEGSVVAKGEQGQCSCAWRSDGSFMAGYRQLRTKISYGRAQWKPQEEILVEFYLATSF